MGLTMRNLINNFDKAKEDDWNYVAVKVRMTGFPKDEIIINESENFDSKLAYYIKTYDENLNHQFSQGISIVGFSYGDRFDDIEDDLVE